MPHDAGGRGADAISDAHDLQRFLVQLLDTLHADQMDADLGGGDPLCLKEIRWHLTRWAHDDEINEVVDTELELALRAAAGWRAKGGGWQIYDTAAGESIQTKLLNERRSSAAEPVTPTRQLTRLVNLLRDPAYAEVAMPVKLQQLAHVCAAELLLANLKTADAEVERLRGKLKAALGISSGVVEREVA